MPTYDRLASIFYILYIIYYCNLSLKILVNILETYFFKKYLIIVFIYLLTKFILIIK